ncbi:hypothetical protein LWI29_035246 [Acer saccharum]|uniref:Uncharacterized protein n=1 Tax=Acer saccharum TaxID=4024 RepID=A0AA39SZJ7_ACESA|nr:hypothetical protein LWI29_035246 [Acer saccharum]
MGGRKFAFQNIAPCGCSPQAKQDNNLNINECYEEMLEFPKLHNNALVNATKELEIQLPEFKYMIFDFCTALLDMTYNPSKYGIKEVDIGCCGSGIFRGDDCGIGEYDLCSDPNDWALRQLPQLPRGSADTGFCFGKFFVCTLILYLKFSWLVKRAKLIRIHQYQFGGSD